jgi:hypothetical protein
MRVLTVHGTAHYDAFFSDWRCHIVAGQRDLGGNPRRGALHREPGFGGCAGASSGRHRLRPWQLHLSPTAGALVSIFWCAGSGVRPVRGSLSGGPFRDGRADGRASPVPTGRRVTPHVATNRDRGLVADHSDAGVGMDDWRDDVARHARDSGRRTWCGSCGNGDGRCCRRLAVSRAGCGRLSPWR